MKKRLLSLLLCLAMLLPMLPIHASAKNDLAPGVYTDRSSISGSMFTQSPELAEKLDRVWDGNVSIYTDYSCTQLHSAALGTQNVPDNKIDLYVGRHVSGTSCLIYGVGIYYSLFDDVVTGGGVICQYEGKPGGHSEKIYEAAGCVINYYNFSSWGVRDGVGALVRVGNHSIMVLDYDEETLTYADGNGDNHGLVAVRKLTWDQVRATGAINGRILYIVQPKESYMTEMGYNCQHKWQGAGKCTKCGHFFHYGSAQEKGPSGQYVPGVYKALKTCQAQDVPYEDGKDARRLTKNKEYNVMGCVTNAYGSLWYELDDGTYIFESKMKRIRDLDSKIDCDIFLPSKSIQGGKAVSVGGSVKSYRPITNIKAYVREVDGYTVLGPVNWNPGTKEVTSFRRTKLDYGLDFGKLNTAGSYHLIVEATDGNKTATDFFAFQVEVPDTPNCAEPEITVTDVIGGKQAALHCSTGGTALYYTTDGSTPTTSSTRYTTPFVLSENAELKVLASRSGYNSSKASQMVYVSQLAAPTVQKEQTSQGVRVTAVSEPGAAIYYSIDDGGWNRYSGPFYVKTASKISVRAEQKGYGSSGHYVDTVKPEPPAKPQLKVIGSGGKVAVGQNATVCWNPDAGAEMYCITVSFDGQTVYTAEQPDSEYSFTLEQAGVYTVEAYAKNAMGQSPAADPVTVEAMAPVTATFMDADQGEAAGEQLTQVTVDYGTYVKEIPNPSRRGHNFVGWSKEGSPSVSLNAYKLEPLTANTTFVAHYEPKTYTVVFRDVDGYVMSTKEVVYQQAASAPDYASRVPSGYTFAQWNVIRADSDSNCDFSCVDSDMEVQAVIRWANPTLPVYTTIGKATSEGGYTIPVTLKNWPDADSHVYVCAALKTTDQSTGVMKTVFADRQMVNLAAGETMDVTFNLTYAGNAGTVEILVLERKDDGTTGSTYSALASATIISKTSWSDWSSWSTARPAAKDGRVVEKKTEYRYRDKETTTSSRASMSGWTRYSHNTFFGDYGSWSDWSDSYIASNDTTDVQTRTAYYYFYFLCPDCGMHSYVYGDCHTWAGGCGRHNTSESDYHWLYHPNPYSNTWDYHGTGRRYIDTEEYGRLLCIPYSSWGDYREPITQYRYRTRTITDTYYFYRWSDWSSWSDRSVSSSSNKSVETRTVYRYRDEQISYAPTEEATEGQTYTVSGNLNVNEDLQGKKATIMVYQSQNMDANQYQMQYVGQTTLGSGNAYHFDFIPMQEPTANTGNFVVALGVEGTTGLINVAILEAPKPSFNVKFYYVNETGDSITLDEQVITKGEDAAAPQVPERPGYIFAGWNQRTTNIIDHCSIEAIYVPREYTVAFVDWANETVGFQTGTMGTPIQAPYAPTAEGMTFKGWDKLLENPNAAIEGTTLVHAVYEPQTYTVRFLSEDGTVVETQQVAHGEAAKLPEGPAGTDKQFLAWSNDTTWWNVTEDLDVKAIMSYAETTAAPMSSIPEYYSANTTVVELTAAPNAEIHYTLDGTEPTAASTAYAAPIYLTESTQVKAMAVEPGKNDSEVITVHFTQDSRPMPAELPEKTLLTRHTVQAVPGETINLDVNLGTNPGLTGYLIYVECDRNIFEVPTDPNSDELVVPGAAYRQGNTMTAYYGQTGWQVLWYGTTAVHQTGTLFTMPLYVSEEAAAGPYEITISYSPANTISADFEEIVLPQDSVQVGGQSSQGLTGDANGDGKTTLSDVILMARSILNLEQIPAQYQAQADVTGDGKITNKDVIKLSRYLVGLELTL